VTNKSILLGIADMPDPQKQQFLRKKSRYTKIILAIALVGILSFDVLNREVISASHTLTTSATTRRCVELAERRLLSFTETTAEACRDVEGQRGCQQVLAHDAIPELMRATIDGGCARACQFHAIVSELGGSKVSRVPLAAFLRAFIVTQPEDSVLNVWTSPWDNYTLPDIAKGCTEDDADFNEKRLNADRWRDRIHLRKLERRDFGSWNLFRLWLYRALGNDFRVYVSVRRLSDMIRFKLLDLHGGIYIDSDILLLRDLTPLCNSTFLYPWQNQEKFDNNAVIGSPKDGPFIAEFIRLAGNSALAYHPLKWRKIAGNNVVNWPTRLPVMTFDPVWLKDGGMDSRDPAEYHFVKAEDFARKNITLISTRDDAFPASLGYHWRGGFSSIPNTPHPGSMFSQLNNLACKKSY
jgi:hypothetical protein